jgi:subtilase family serine protease
LGTPIEEFHFISEINGLTCPDKNVFTTSTINNSFYRIITSTTALTPLPELVDAGLNRKYGEVSGQCAGNNVVKVSTNNTTLDIIRAQIPAPTSSNPVVFQDVTWPNIKWGVKNTGIATSSSFTIQLKDGETILQSQTLNGLGSGEERLFTYERPKSTKRLFRSLTCNPNQDVFVFQKAIRSEADLRMMEPYIWNDPSKFTIVIDAFQNVTETDETNNTRDY